MKRRIYKKTYSDRNRKRKYFFYSLLLFIALLVLVFANRQNSIKKIKITPFLTTDGTKLIEKGLPYTFVGYNIYQIASLSGHNATCGGNVDNIKAFFSVLRPNSVIRFWAWQGSMAINPVTKELDWSGIDRVLTTAKKYKQKVILSLGTQSGTCDDGKWKDSTWYQGGYKNVYNSSGLTPLSYWDYIQKIVKRYKNSQALAMWELINEPEASDCVNYTGVNCYQHQLCPDHKKAALILRKFFDTVGGKIKSIDPNHIIESGLIGTGQCGSDNQYYAYVNQSPAIDVASYHDYNDVNSPMPGDQWNGLAVRLNQMKSINKPLIIGEDGILAQKLGGSCLTLEERKDKIKAKMDSMFKAGIAGFLLWNLSTIPDTICNYDISGDDPLVKLINLYHLPT